MKKYWNKLIFAAIALLAGAATACSDDEESVPDYYYGNYAYLYYQLYPETNAVPALQARHDARGVMATGLFRDFHVRLKRPVETDTRFKFGIDAAAVDPEKGGIIPESALTFMAAHPETGEITEEIIIPAGESDVEVRVILNDTEFANVSMDPVNFYAPVYIKEMSGSKELKISSNRNQIEYSIEVGAYIPNTAQLQVASGANESTLKGKGAEDLLNSYFGDMLVQLGYPSEKDVKVTFAADYSLNAETDLQIPISALRFTVDGAPVSNNTVTVPAGASSVAVKAQLTDASFLIAEDAEYRLPIVITAVEGDDIEFDSTFFFQIKQASLDFNEPTTGSLETDRSAYKLSQASDVVIYGNLSSLIDGSTSTYNYAGSKKKLDFAVDFGTVKQVIGVNLQVYYNMSMYAIRYGNLYTSENGTDWKLLYELEDMPKQSPQYISFPAINTRYLRLELTEGHSSTIYLSEFYIYVK